MTAVIVILALAVSPSPAESAVAFHVKQAVAAEKVQWNLDEQAAMVELCRRESRFDPLCQNASSTAFGLWQFLDSTWRYYGIAKTSDPQRQTVAAVRYISDRYGTPKAALGWHDLFGWY